MSSPNFTAHWRRTGADRGRSQQMAVSSASGGIHPLSHAPGAPHATSTGRPCPHAPSGRRHINVRACFPCQTPQKPRKPAIKHLQAEAS